jgi:copper oxidase (laccase) domain-containing protein
MNEKFCVVEHKSLRLLVYEPWWSKGLIHGMTLRPFSCDTSRWEKAKDEVQRCLGLIDIFIPKQSHTTNIHNFREISKEQFWGVIRGEQADAFVVPRKQSLSEGFGVFTADCVPLIVKSTNDFAVIHAGWRGLARMIIPKVLRQLSEIEEIVIFPCAGGRLYEVGAEVIEDIGDTAVFDARTGSPDKYLLDTAATAIHQVQLVCPDCSIACADICTIEDTRFHSFRRDGTASGRNLTFVTV